jgi:hypothetical protein
MQIVSRDAAGQEPFLLLAEADGNRTRLTEVLGHVGFEDRVGNSYHLRP